MPVITAWWSGIWRTAQAPLLVIGIYLMTLVIAVPVGAMLLNQLPADEARLAPITETPAPPDADWLDEAAARAGIFADSLTPAIVGVAAPITNLTSLLDGRGWALPAFIASAGYFLCWTWLWGGVIFRLRAGRAVGLVAFIGESTRHMTRMIAAGLIGLLIYIVIFTALQPILFGPLFRMVSEGGLERSAFLWRVAIAVVFSIVLVVVSQALDSARIMIVFGRSSVGVTLGRGFRFVGANLGAVAALALINGLMLTALIAAYGATEFVPGGSVPGTWRIVIVGQAYLLARLFLRLAGIGALVSFWEHKPMTESADGRIADGHR